MPSARSRRSFAEPAAPRRRAPAGRPGRPARPGPTAGRGRRGRRPRPRRAATMQVEHLRDVPVVGPAGRAPRHDAGVRQLAARQRAVRRAAGRGCRAGSASLASHPVPQALLPVAQRLAVPATRAISARNSARSSAGRTIPCSSTSDCRPARRAARRRVRRPEPAPQHQVGAGRDGRGRVVLQQRQVPHDLDQVGRPRRRRAAAPARRAGARPAATAGASRVEPLRTVPTGRALVRPNLRALPSGARRLSRPPSPPVAGSGRCARPG